MIQNFSERLIAELHKDAYGYRPTQSFWDTFACFNVDQKRAMWDRILADICHSVEADRHNEQLAVDRFEKEVQHRMSYGSSREKIVTWMLYQAGCLNDPEQFEFHNNLPFGYLTPKEHA